MDKIKRLSERGWRTRLADELLLRGSYYSRHSGKYPLTWDVSVYTFGHNVDEVIEVLTQDHYFNEADLIIQYPNAREFIKTIMDDLGGRYSFVYENVLEQMRTGVTDADTYRTWSPEVAKRHGLSRQERGSAKPFSVEFVFEGRGGKHLCIRSFDDIPLTGDLADNLRDPNEGFPKGWARNLCAMIDEWDRMFMHSAIEAEAKYQFAQCIQWEFERGGYEEYEKDLDASRFP